MRSSPPDLICFSHLRWNFVFQRPQHLMTRFARHRRVFFFEEPLPSQGTSRLEVSRVTATLWIVTPHLVVDVSSPEGQRAQGLLLREFLREHRIERYIAWYYTPMAITFSGCLEPLGVVYDCMDELSAFLGAPPLLRDYERRLIARADVMLTGGYSLYEAKRGLHGNVHAFPSSVDIDHFAPGTAVSFPPHDQAGLPRPRLGYAGVIDERMDYPLLAGIAEARPEWNLVLIGPTAKIDPNTLPRRPNLHYLGARPYARLPAYFASWDVCLLPFAHNSATRFISPTKTPEYLAARRPVVSTSIPDVVRVYGNAGVVRIADSLEGFVSAVEASLQPPSAAWHASVDALLGRTSWEATWSAMDGLLARSLAGWNGGVPPALPLWAGSRRV